jgi:glycine betaine/proline transport system substrate-binding protein
MIYKYLLVFIFLYVKKKRRFISFMKYKILLMVTIFLISIFLFSLTLTSAAKDKIVFADPGWDSARFHNGIAQTIIEEGYGYPTEVIAGSTAATF